MSPEDASAIAQVHGNDPVLAAPEAADGAALWSLAREAGSLDVNSPYSYLLWCRDFAATSVIARDGDRLAGFVTGFVRPNATDTLFVWQVAVAPSHRRRGLARRMLDHLVESLAPQGIRYIEATVTPSNESSTRLFTSFAAANGTEPVTDVLFAEKLFPQATEESPDHGHEPEVLFRIGPIGRSGAPVAGG